VSVRKNNFESIDRKAVPRTRKSKHHDVVEQILEEIGSLQAKRALKIPRSALGGAKIENFRAALNRVSTREKVELATSSDDEYFYVWRLE
jgi:hypothetical protein